MLSSDGVGSRFLLVTESQSLVAAEVLFEFGYSPAASRGLQLCAEAVKACVGRAPLVLGGPPLPLRGPRCLSEGPPSVISLLMEGAWLVNEAFCFCGVLKSNSVIIAAGYDSYSRTKCSNNTSAEKVPL